MRDLDMSFEEPVDSNFKKSIEGITSAYIVSKIDYPSPLDIFKFEEKLTNRQVNIARFMMEGIGFSSKYWLCCGAEALEHIMEYSIDDGHYNELISISERKDVLCLRGLPLFYTSESHLGNCLLLVSDVKEKKVRTICFMIEDLVKKKPAKKKPASKKPAKKKPAKTRMLDDFEDYDENEIPF